MLVLPVNESVLSIELDAISSTHAELRGRRADLIFVAEKLFGNLNEEFFTFGFANHYMHKRTHDKQPVRIRTDGSTANRLRRWRSVPLRQDV